MLYLLSNIQILLCCPTLMLHGVKSFDTTCLIRNNYADMWCSNAIRLEFIVCQHLANNITFYSISNRLIRDLEWSKTLCYWLCVDTREAVFIIFYISTLYSMCSKHTYVVSALIYRATHFSELWMSYNRSTIGKTICNRMTKSNHDISNRYTRWREPNNLPFYKGQV